MTLILFNQCTSDLPDNAVVVSPHDFTTTVDTDSTVETIDTTVKETVTINISNKRNIKVAKEQQIDIKLQGKNHCFNNKQIDSLIAAINIDYKSSDEIKKAIIDATGSSSCWELMSPGVIIEVNEVNVEVKKEEKIPQKEEIVKTPKQQPSVKPKTIPKKETKVTANKGVEKGKVMYLPAGENRTCEEFAKSYRILNIVTFCKLNGMKPETRLKKTDKLGIPYMLPK